MSDNVSDNVTRPLYSAQAPVIDDREGKGREVTGQSCKLATSNTQLRRGR